MNAKTLYASFVVQFASFASAAGLLIALVQEPHPTWFVPALVAVVILYLLGFTFELHSALTERIIRYRKNSPKIAKFMRHWLNSGGRTAMLSRDLSWVDDATKRVLIEKSQRRELALFVQENTVLTDELKAAGASVTTYGSLGHVPASRFTIIDFEKTGARVAIGSSDGDHHFIQRHQDGKSLLFPLAEDMIRFLRGQDQR